MIRDSGLLFGVTLYCNKLVNN